jgi:uncharacterized protein (DUF58 family)
MTVQELLEEIRDVELITRRLVNQSLAGHYHSVFKGQGMNFDEVREYQPGDDVRTIDWNVTARMNHPFVKKYVEERELTLILMVDLSASMMFGSDPETRLRQAEDDEREIVSSKYNSKKDLAIKIAAALAFSAIHNNDRVGLLLFTDKVEKFIPARKGRRHVMRLLAEIAEFKPAEEKPRTNLVEALNYMNRVAKRHAIVVMISDFLGAPSGGGGIMGLSILQAAESALMQANRRHDLIGVHIADPHEMRLPPLGYLVLRDSETGELVEVNSGDARLREAFEKNWRQRVERMEMLFNSSGIDLISLRTGEAYDSALVRFFERREKRGRHG